jgi:dsRNA-specific ribonuclease
VETQGPEHRKIFTVEARLRALDGPESEFIGRAEGSTKKDAEQDAARQVLEYLAASSEERSLSLPGTRIRESKL